MDLPLRAGEDLVDAPQRDAVELVSRPGPLTRQGGCRFQTGPGKEPAAGGFLGGVEVASKQDRLGTIGLTELREDQPDCLLAALLRQIEVGVVYPERAAVAAVAQANPGADSLGPREPPARRAIARFLQPERALVDLLEPIAVEEDRAVLAAGCTVIAADTDPEMVRHRAFKETDLFRTCFLHTENIGRADSRAEAKASLRARQFPLSQAGPPSPPRRIFQVTTRMHDASRLGAGCCPPGLISAQAMRPIQLTMQAVSTCLISAELNLLGMNAIESERFGKTSFRRTSRSPPSTPATPTKTGRRSPKG